MTVESNDSASMRAMAIRTKLVDLHESILGMTAAIDSPDFDAAYRLFVEVWRRKRSTEGSGFWDSQFRCASWDDHLYSQGLVQDGLGYDEWGNPGMGLTAATRTVLSARGSSHSHTQLRIIGTRNSSANVMNRRSVVKGMHGIGAASRFRLPLSNAAN